MIRDSWLRSALQEPNRNLKELGDNQLRGIVVVAPRNLECYVGLLADEFGGRQDAKFKTPLPPIIYQWSVVFRAMMAG